MDNTKAKKGPSAVPCEEYGEKVLRKKFKRHLSDCRNKDKGGMFDCQKWNCHKVFRSKLLLSAHIQAVHSKPIECPISGCDSVIKKASLPMHIKIVHERIRKECTNCGKKLIYGNLSRHRKSCLSDGSRPYECTQSGCESSFKTPHERSIHVQKVHSEPIECPVKSCGATFKKSSLVRHMKMVDNKFKYPKVLCNDTNCKKMTSSGADSTDRNLKSCACDGSRSFLCNKEGCGSAFRTAHQRSQHIREVHGEPIECPFPDCDARFKKKSLPIHVKRVHEKLKEKCGGCGKELSYGKLTRHSKVCKASESDQ